MLETERFKYTNSVAENMGNIDKFFMWKTVLNELDFLVMTLRTII